MIKNSVRHFSIALMLFVLSIGTAMAVPGGSFSADMVSHEGKQTVKAKIYVAGEKSRMEMAGSIIVTRMDKNVSWIIMPSDKMYMENSIDYKRVPRTFSKMEGEISRESLGKEVINGQDTEKFKVTYAENGETQSVYQWLKGSIIPVKIEAVDGSWGVEYQNISMEKPSDDLFEVPDGYAKMEIPSMPGMDMGSMMKNMMNR